MPQGQVAQGSHYQFGAPSAIATVLEFRQKGNTGGKLQLTFEAPDSTRDVTYSIERSADGITYTALTVAQNLAVVTGIVIAPRTTREHTILLRPTTDKFMRVRASGSDRCGVTVKGNEILELLNIQNELGGGFGDN